MLPTGPDWRPVPDAQPNTRTLAFPAVYNGVQIIGTAIARQGQIDIVPVPGVVLEIPLDAWRGMAPFLTAAALTRPSD